jgi:hypothetical protein
MHTRILLTVVASLGGLTVVAPTTHARAQDCSASVVQQALVSTGKLSQEDVDNGVVVSLVRCGDMTGDAVSDALFTLASGGTVGNTRFGVLKGNADGSLGARILFKQGYGVGIARHSSRSFDVVLPYWVGDDTNCCPSTFRQTRYTFSGGHFKAGKAKKLKKAPARFYRP